MRKIIHIDMDAFFASVEQRDNSELKGKPVAVGGSKKRGVVAAASYEARQFGIHSAMPSVTARRKCPQLIFVPPRFDVYKQVSEEIHQILKGYSDLIEPLSLDEAYLDVSENKRGVTSATEIAQQIKNSIKQQTGLTASAGVSINKFLAKIASDYQKPDGLFVIPPDRVSEFVEQLAVDKFFGVGRVTAQKMKSLGIHTGRDLKQWSLQDLVQKFGKAGYYFFDVSHGLDNRPVVPHRVRKSIGAEHTFAEDKDTIESLRESLAPIAEEVTRRVIRQDIQGHTITLKIKFSDFTQITRSQSLAEPVDDYCSIFSNATHLLEKTFKQGMFVRLLGISLSNLTIRRKSARQLLLDL